MADSSGRPPTPDHFEDDGGRHDGLRKQVRGIGEQLAGELHEQRKILQATKLDRNKHVPEGATSARNQYKLLMTPRNRNFLSQLGLDPEISRHLPATREEIGRLYSKLDRVLALCLPRASMSTSVQQACGSPNLMQSGWYNYVTLIRTVMFKSWILSMRFKSSSR